MDRKGQYVGTHGMQCWQNGPDQAGNNWEMDLVFQNRQSFFNLI
jgi:hypothetical protein